ncbi:MAG: ABC transporter permease subunit [Bryobacterales bacterium]|nr:ABC transporter permease subunit [Bryobacterales bacterium]
MRTLAGKLAGLVLTLVVGGLLGATLVRLAPGADVDEREQDARLSEASLAALRRENAAPDGVVSFYAGYLGRLIAGDFGKSRGTGQPVREILAERAPLTLRSAGFGYLLAWVGGLALALLLAGLRSSWLDVVGAGAAGLLLSLPAACIGFVALWTGIGLEWAVGAVLFPKIFLFSSALLGNLYGRPHVLQALAKGLSSARILVFHVLWPAVPELAALAGATTGLAFGAAIPLEVVCDSPGLGQLAWQAATARDLPVLVALTLLVTLVVKTSDILAELVRSGLRESRA